MIRAKNYKTVTKFVKVMLRILWPLFFPDTVYIVSLPKAFKACLTVGLQVSELLSCCTSSATETVL